MPQLVKLMMLSCAVHQVSSCCFAPTNSASLRFNLAAGFHDIQLAAVRCRASARRWVDFPLSDGQQHRESRQPPRRRVSVALAHGRLLLTALTIRSETVLSTTLVTLAVSTAVLGAALIATGVMKLASLVQFLPMPVVGSCTNSQSLTVFSIFAVQIGGYLAFIGEFCVVAGIIMMTGLQLQSESSQCPRLEFCLLMC